MNVDDGFPYLDSEVYTGLYSRIYVSYENYEAYMNGTLYKE
jgi:hypothetical protein